MELYSSRFGTGSESTISNIRQEADEGGEALGFILEDQYQTVKVPGETCIPVGRYRILLRTDSPKFAHYYDRWDWYRGMPWLQEVEREDGSMSFTYVYIHPGTDDDDSSGCLICGEEYVETTDGNWQIKRGTSRPAFEKICKLIYAAMSDRDEEVWITIDEEQLLE